MAPAFHPAQKRPGRLSVKQRVGKWPFPRLPISRFLSDILGDEADAFIVRGKNACLPGRRTIAAFATIECSRSLQSRDPRLAIDRDVHARYSRYVEAIK